MCKIIEKPITKMELSQKWSLKLSIQDSDCFIKKKLILNSTKKLA